MANPLLFERMYCEARTFEGGSGFKIRTKLKDDIIINKKELISLSKNNDIQIQINKNILKPKKKKSSKKEIDEEEYEELKEKHLTKKFRRMYIIGSYLGGLRISNFSYSLIGKRITTENFAKLWEEKEIIVKIRVKAWKRLKEMKEENSQERNSNKKTTKKINFRKAKKELKEKELKDEELKQVLKKLKKVS